MENQAKIKGIYLVGGLRFHTDFPSFLTAIEEAFAAGIRLFQLRIKDELSDKEHLELAKKVRDLTHTFNVTFIVNDRPDIAMASDADGVHIGPGDMPVTEARKIMGNRIVGYSSHSWEQAEKALEEPISYLSVGPVFKTDSKKIPDKVVGLPLLEKVIETSDKPIVAIGGIDQQNIAEVKQTGVGCIGLIRAVMNAADISLATESLITHFNQV